MNKAKYFIFLLAFLLGALSAFFTQPKNAANASVDTEANCPDENSAYFSQSNQERKIPDYIFLPVSSTYQQQQPLPLPVKSLREITLLPAGSHIIQR